MRSENEEKMRRGFERTAAELKKELNETKSALTKDQVNASTLLSENRMIKSLLEREQERRKNVSFTVGRIRFHVTPMKLFVCSIYLHISSASKINPLCFFIVIFH